MSIETRRMNPEAKAEWVAALRSGNYRQAKGVLRDGAKTMCCIGVLCDLQVKNGIGHWKKDLFQDDVAVWGHLYNGRAIATPAVRAYVDLPSTSPILWGLADRDGHNAALTELNDQGFTFDQIADLIEYFL